MNECKKCCYFGYSDNPDWIKKDGTSNHAWTGGPLVIMSKHIAGIRPVNAGYEKVEINPQYELHNSISCTVPTIKGYINFDYRNENGKRIINLEYPENMETFLHIPENAVVTVNGKFVESVIQNICWK